MNEREVENFLESILKGKGWKDTVGDSDRNVYRQHPRTKEEIEKLRDEKGNIKFPDYILYESENTKDPIAIIEVKKPNYKDLNQAKNQGLYYAKKLNAKYLFLYNKNQCKAIYVPTEEYLYIDKEEVNDILSLEELLKFEGNKLKSSSLVIRTKQDLINIFNKVNSKLRESGITVGIQRFTEFSNLLFLKLINELNDEMNYKLPANLLWNSFKNLKGETLLTYINDTVIPRLNSQFKANEDSSSLFTKLKIKNTTNLEEIVETIDKLEFGKIDSDIKGDAFEYFIQKYNQRNNDLGEYFTPRHIVKFLVSIMEPKMLEKIYDPFCGTGGMLSTAYSHLKNLNPTADIRLFGQELMGQSYAVGLAEMLIKDQNAENFRHADTLKEDCFKDTKMRFLLENPPFGTPWKGANAKSGQEEAVIKEHDKETSRWKAGLPSGGDSQLLFMQSAVDKLDEVTGRAAIITNGSPLFNGGVSSGESQIRRWLLEEDLIEAIIAMPTDMFYNTGIATYVWILSKNKREERKGRIQLIDARDIYHSLRKSLGNKRREFTREDRQKITALYADFEENDLSQIHDNETFIYREYTVMQPLQRSYAINKERIENLEMSNALNTFYDEAKHRELLEKEELGEKLKKTEKTNLAKYEKNRRDYEEIFLLLNRHISDQKYLSKDEFEPVLADILSHIDLPKTIFTKIIDGLSLMDKEARIERDKKGHILYDKDTKDTEIVNVREDIDDYMEREVLPHIPDAAAFFEEDLTLKNPKIKTGAEIPFTRYFYRYEAPRPSEELAREFLELEEAVNQKVKELFGED